MRYIIPKMSQKNPRRKRVRGRSRTTQINQIKQDTGNKEEQWPEIRRQKMAGDLSAILNQDKLKGNSSRWKID